MDHWYQVTAIDVQAVGDAAAVVALGDSITDGHGATTNGNDRWTDALAARLQSEQATREIGVSNQGIGGNHLLTDGLGPNALARFDRDVLAPAGVRWVIVFEGVNDLGGLARLAEVTPPEHSAMVQQVIAAYEQMIARAHAHGLTSVRRDDHALCGIGVLSPWAIERSGPASGERVDSGSGSFRRDRSISTPWCAIRSIRISCCRRSIAAIICIRRPRDTRQWRRRFR